MEFGTSFAYSDTEEVPIPMTQPIPTSPREALALTPWLTSVPQGTLDRLADQAVLHRVPSGSLLFEQAATAAFAEFVVRGSVELLGVRSDNENLVELIEPVDLLLPAAVLNRQPYLLRARVLEEAHLLMIQAEAFRDAVASDHALCLAILACEAAQFRRQIKQIKNFTLRSAEERVGTYLIRLFTAARTENAVQLPVEKRLIASQLGMTRETFSRTLAAMRKHGLRVSGDFIFAEDFAAAQARFPLDPLIDGAELVNPLPVRRR